MREMAGCMKIFIAAIVILAVVQIKISFADEIVEKIGKNIK